MTSLSSTSASAKQITVGESVQYPFKDLKKEDRIKLTLKDGRYFVVKTFLRPISESLFAQDGKPIGNHEVSLRIAGCFRTPRRNLDDVVGWLRTANSNLDPTTISLKDFTFYPCQKHIQTSIDYDPCLELPYEMTYGAPLQLPIEKVEKVTLVTTPIIEAAGSSSSPSASSNTSSEEKKAN